MASADAPTSFVRADSVEYTEFLAKEKAAQENIRRSLNKLNLPKDPREWGPIRDKLQFEINVGQYSPEEVKLLIELFYDEGIKAARALLDENYARSLGVLPINIVKEREEFRTPAIHLNPRNEDDPYSIMRDSMIMYDCVREDHMPTMKEQLQKMGPVNMEMTPFRPQDVLDAEKVDLEPNETPGKTKALGLSLGEQIAAEIDRQRENELAFEEKRVRWRRELRALAMGVLSSRMPRPKDAKPDPRAVQAEKDSRILDEKDKKDEEAAMIGVNAQTRADRKREVRMANSVVNVLKNMSLSEAATSSSENDEEEAKKEKKRAQKKEQKKRKREKEKAKKRAEAEGNAAAASASASAGLGSLSLDDSHGDNGGDDTSDGRNIATPGTNNSGGGEEM